MILSMIKIPTMIWAFPILTIFFIAFFYGLYRLFKAIINVIGEEYRKSK